MRFVVGINFLFLCFLLFVVLPWTTVKLWISETTLLIGSVISLSTKAERPKALLDLDDRRLSVARGEEGMYGRVCYGSTRMELILCFF